MNNRRSAGTVRFRNLEIGSRFGWFETHDSFGDPLPSPVFRGPYVKNSKTYYRDADGKARRIPIDYFVVPQD